MTEIITVPKGENNLRAMLAFARAEIAKSCQCPIHRAFAAAYEDFLTLTPDEKLEMLFLLVNDAIDIIPVDGEEPETTH